MTSPLRISTAVDLEGQARARTYDETEIDRIQKSLDALQLADPAGYYNVGRQKLRDHLKKLKEDYAARPVDPVHPDKISPAPAAAPIFAAALHGTQFGVSDLKLQGVPI